MVNKTTYIIFSFLQSLILGLCIFENTTTLPSNPWYEPLTFGAYWIVLITIPIQIIIVVFFWYGFLKGQLTKKNFIVPSINLFFQITGIVLPNNTTKMGYGLTYFAIVLEIILLIVVIYLALQHLTRTSRNQ